MSNRRSHLPAQVIGRRHLWFTGLIFGAVLVPAAVYGAVVWRDRVAILGEAERRAQIVASEFEQHARNVFETHSLVASLVSEHIGGMSWEAIGGSEELHRF